MEFVRIKIDDGFVNRLRHEFKIHLETQIGSCVKTLRIVSDKHSPHHEFARRVSAYDRKYVHNRDVTQKVLRCIIENVADGVVRASHDSLHPVDGSEVVTAIDAFGTTSADQNILIEIRHSDNFVGHHLADGQYEIESAFRYKTIHFRRPVIVKLPFRLLMYIARRYNANQLCVGTPIVRTEYFMWHFAEHRADLLSRHRPVRSKRRQDCP